MKILALTLIASLATIATLRAEDTKLTVGEFDFLVTSPWIQGQNTGMMTKAVLQLPVEGGTPLDAKFYDFGGPSGGIDANIQRWVGQFEGTPEVKKEELEFKGTKVILLTVTGTYMDGMPGGAKTSKADHTLCGAILAGAKSNIFIKFTGPKEIVTKAQEAFKKLATSPFAK